MRLGFTIKMIEKARNSYDIIKPDLAKKARIAFGHGAKWAYRERNEEVNKLKREIEMLRNNK